MIASSSFRLTRRSTLAALGASVSALALPGCARTLAAGSPAAGPNLAALLDSFAWNLLAHEPERASELGVDKGEHAALRARLEDRSAAGQAAYAATLRADLARAEAADLSAADPTTRTSFEAVRSAYRIALDGFALPYGDVPVGSWRVAPYVVIQNVGAYLDTPRFLDSEHPVNDAADAEAYLARLGAMAGQIEGETERTQSAAAMNLIPPGFLIDRTLKQMDASLADWRRGGGALAASLMRRTGAIPGAWQARAAEIVTGRVVPALERQRALMAELRPRADDAPGLGVRPDGERWYRWALRSSTTTTLSPAEIHAQGREELAALHAQMDPLLRQIGLTQGSVGQRMAALGADKRFRFPEGDPGRAEIMAAIQQHLDYIRAQMPRAFLRPARGNVEVRRLPPAEEPGAPGAYGGGGSIDGSVPGKFWINLRETGLHSRFDLETLTHHEAIPGHVWESEYGHRLPLIRSILAFNPYSEGWALYAQQLGDELGAYEDDPAGRLGYLQSLAFRACRMVVDTGLHAMRWTRAQAVDFFVTENGSNPIEVAGEVDRYCSWPGQACGYKMGHSEIVRQRRRASAELGGAYELRAFNQAVVEGGNVPLDVLGGILSRYIAAARAG